jgi:hypothetical protein
LWAAAIGLLPDDTAAISSVDVVYSAAAVWGDGETLQFRRGFVARRIDRGQQ